MLGRMRVKLLSDRRVAAAVAALAACGLAFVLAAAWPRAASAQAAGGIQVEARGLRIVGEGAGKDAKEVRPFNWQKGTTLAVLITKPDGGIVKFDDDASKLDRFTDEKGTDLLKGTGWGRAGFGSFPKTSDDGTACIIEIDGKGVPAKGCKEIQAAGILVLKCGGKKQTFTHKNVALTAGTKISAGDIPFEIKKVGKPQWGDAALHVTLRTTTDVSRIAEIKFLDEAGKDIGVGKAGHMISGAGGRVTVERTYSFPKKVDKTTVAITYWMDLKEVKVPFDLKVSVGL